MHRANKLFDIFQTFQQKYGRGMNNYFRYILIIISLLYFSRHVGFSLFHSRDDNRNCVRTVETRD